MLTGFTKGDTIIKDGGGRRPHGWSGWFPPHQWRPIASISKTIFAIHSAPEPPPVHAAMLGEGFGHSLPAFESRYFRGFPPGSCPQQRSVPRMRAGQPTISQAGTKRSRPKRSPLGHPMSERRSMQPFRPNLHSEPDGFVDYPIHGQADRGNDPTTPRAQAKGRKIDEIPQANRKCPAQSSENTCL